VAAEIAGRHAVTEPGPLGHLLATDDLAGDPLGLVDRVAKPTPMFPDWPPLNEL